MEVSNDILLYKEDIISIAYEKYKVEMSVFHNYTLRDKNEIEHYIQERFPKLKGVVYKDDQVAGYLLYYTYKDKQTTYCTVPVWGYGATTNKKEKIMTRLFQKAAEELVGKGNVHFEINLYAHDVEMQRVFSFMEFGIQCETGIRQIEKNPEPIRNTIRELFTEEIYNEFFCDEATRVFIAEKGLAKDLLNYVDQTMISKGYDYEWVEHGTANPNARGYWNKYFDSYCYTMIRDIDGRKLKRRA